MRRASVPSRCSRPHRSPRGDRSHPQASSCRRGCGPSAPRPAPAISSPRYRSLAEPSTSTPMPSPASRAASSANRSLGQRFAGPYSAPGIIATIRSSLGRSRSRHKRSTVGRIDPQPRAGRREDAHAGRCALGRKSNEALYGLIERRIERPHIVEKSVAPFAAKAGSARHTREKRHERGLRGTRQHDRLSVVLRPQPPPKLKAFAQTELAMLNRNFDAAANFGHAPENRQGPRRREHVNLGSRLSLEQQSIQRLRHHHVAHPRRTDDQHLSRRSSRLRVERVQVSSCTPALTSRNGES